MIRGESAVSVPWPAKIGTFRYEKDIISSKYPVARGLKVSPTSEDLAMAKAWTTTNYKLNMWNSSIAQQILFRWRAGITRQSKWNLENYTLPIAFSNSRRLCSSAPSILSIAMAFVPEKNDGKIRN